MPCEHEVLQVQIKSFLVNEEQFRFLISFSREKRRTVIVHMRFNSDKCSYFHVLEQDLILPRFCCVLIFSFLRILHVYPAEALKDHINAIVIVEFSLQ